MQDSDRRYYYFRHLLRSGGRARLTQRERWMMRMRYGLWPTLRPMTLKAIGVESGVTGSRVGQIIREAEYKLRLDSAWTL